MKKLVIVILALLSAEFIAACCECTAPTFHNYTNTGLLLKNLDNSGSLAVESSSNIIRKTAYGIRLRVKGEKVASIQRNTVFFTQPLYATSCECPPDIQYIPKDSITAIRIITLSEFDAEHTSGADITNLFKVFEENKFYSITEFLKNTYTPIYPDSFDKENLHNTDFLLMLPPSLGTVHRFKVEIVLSDGRVLFETTPVVELTK